MQLEELMDCLRQKGLNDLKAKTGGSYALHVNDGHDLFLTPAHHGCFFMYAHLRRVLENDTERAVIFEGVLNSQLFQEASHGCHVGYDPASCLLVLFKKEMGNCDFDHWMKHVENFIHELERWQALLQDWLTRQESASSYLTQQLVRV